ncbi:bifunctional oligoribonuclease and PAP phosphatase NrnA [Mariprofundus micogutta]|uniref:Bifunctional oligoribonuclease and PAP phosphatase NrnA n=1 Tax=Mariprofundus micogutta TaxID=1921010 RepID=A0A1L8CPQ3_9PROT|nr:bifunctional oligoribonuclease/PAP phosphatase NrnA [Mariprofundus micogutta]GAV20902.1 bifunctional oligoribonuclease and PAP phosphatase NrnA [Mariprofundus micogutta]
MHSVISDVNWQPVMDAINGAEQIVLITHCNPDGDGIGSQLALYDALTELGKSVTMFNVDGVPRIYTFLDHADKVGRGHWHSDTSGGDLIIALDCGSKARLGMPDAFYDGATLLNIDHHASNKLFGDINLVDARYCATGAMIFDLLIAMKSPVSKATASAIYTAVLTDTASFRLSNSTAAVYRMAAELIDAGARPWPISVHVYESRPLAGLKMMSACLDTLEVHNEGRSAWVHITSDMYEATGADVEDTEGLIDYARSIDGVEVAVFIRCDERRENCWKVSFRGKTYVDVGALAASLGGGGHTYASGCLMRGTFDEVRSSVEQAVTRIFA